MSVETITKKDIIDCFFCWRIRKEITIQRAAMMLGISKSMLAMIEAGTRKIRGEILTKMLELMK